MRIGPSGYPLSLPLRDSREMGSSSSSSCKGSLGANRVWLDVLGRSDRSDSPE